MPLSWTTRQKEWTINREIGAHLDYLLALGFVTNEENGAFRLTETGAAEARKMDQGITQFAARVNAFISSRETASKVSMLVNAMIATLKLGVGFIFNSMALVADGFDSMVDVVSAIVVFAGIKYKREFYSTSFIIVMMFGTAGFIGYEAISRLISPSRLTPLHSPSWPLLSPVVSAT